jgi:spore germination cell wall hydrolase CwlJ-like protein
MKRTAAVTAGLLMLILTAREARAMDPPDEQRCMAEALYYEARDQGTMGMVAVAAVIKNRMKSDSYPDTACGVVHQAKMWAGAPIRHKCQFSYFCDGLPERPAEKEAWEMALQIAGALIDTDFKMVGLEQATHYHTISVQPSWATVLEPCGRVGDHLFYAAP